MGSLLTGLVDYIWAYPRVMCIFWFVFAFGLAAAALWPGTVAGKLIGQSGSARWWLLLLCFLFGLWAILFSAGRRSAPPPGNVPPRDLTT